MDMNEEYGLTPYETREILFYKTDNGEVRVEILLYQENLWLTQAKMAELFEVQKAAISKHLKNIFTSGELQEEAVVSKMETTAADGKRYNTSYYNLDAIISVKTVASLDEAIRHINRYNTGHSEAIITKDYDSALRFQDEIDAAAVYVNASTRFTDGFEFGFGAEIGISTQKLHARGPMGLEALTTTKYIIFGNGQIRK